MERLLSAIVVSRLTLGQAFGLTVAREGVLGEGIIYEVVLDSDGDGRTIGGLRPGDAHTGKYSNSHGDCSAIPDFGPNRSTACFPLNRTTRGEY